VQNSKASKPCQEVIRETRCRNLQRGTTVTSRNEAMDVDFAGDLSLLFVPVKSSHS
jgi:hypothetical protein